MNPIDVAKLNVAQRLKAGGAAPVARAEAGRQVGNEEGKAAAAAAAPAVSRVTAGQAAPVDNDRVQQIRRAIEKGEYPIYPTEIADAMIAAGYLLRVKK